MYKEKYESWLSANLDEQTHSELLAIKNNDAEIEDRFWKDLEFGTAGLRGIMGVGANRMNIYTVRKATQGLAEYIKECGESAMKRGVAIAFDSRNNSPEFARECARVLAANKIHTFIYPELRSTPQLSFTIRHLSCIAGLMVTASHNPKEYNGYKCYWEDGAQMSPTVSDNLIKVINTVNPFEVGVSDDSEYIHEIGAEIDVAYLDAVMKQQINPDAKENNLKIVFTPLYGAGNIPIRRVLKEAGFDNVTIVKEQEEPNGNFPTAPYPNPEKLQCWEIAKKYADNGQADIIIATDPDSDRVGVCSPDKSGKLYVFTGNEVGAMLTEFVLSQRLNNGTMPQNPAVISTIVSSRLAQKICENYNVAYFDVYTGFKFIAEKVLEFEQNKSHNFIIGWEESIGYTIGTHTRDKDAIVSSLVIAEMAQWCKNRGKTLHDFLAEIHAKYGKLYEETIDLVKEGIDGAKEITATMKSFRDNPPSEIGGIKVAKTIDYLTAKNPSNVLIFKLVTGGQVCVRPSGTEPKIKFYFSAVSKEELAKFKEILDDRKPVLI
jgi:phosphoglucomutase